ncbi:transposase, partial [Paraburkholderia mimosarum]|uniref:transposase n=1 Tax=Paraburkholderia mimosarum TaxID=312026 RepID=UPI001FD0509F
IKYLNNIVEQDHRAIKRRIRPMLGFKNFHRARVILGGIEVMHNLSYRRDFFGWRSRQPAHRHVVGPDPRPVIKKMFVLNRSTGGGRYGH